VKKFLSTVMASLVPFALSGIAASPAQATVTPVPFSCDSTLYQATATNSGAMYSFDTTTQLFSRFGTGNASGLNAIGYNTKDNLIYGLAGGKLTVIDSTGTYSNPWGNTQVSNSPASTGGDFLPYGGLGDAYLLTAPSSGGSWTKIDVDTNSATSYSVSTGSGAVAWGAFDLTISADGTTAYGVQPGSTSGSADIEIVTLGASTGTIATKHLDTSSITGNAVIGSNDSFGAAYSDVAGDKFFFDNSTQYMYMITAASLATSTPAITVFGARSSLSSPNDGASCGLASSPLAPTTVTTDAGANPTGGNVTLTGSVVPGNFAGASIAAGAAKICYSTSATVTNGLLSVLPVCSAGNGSIISAGTTSNALSFALTGLAPGTYYYQAQATNANATNQGLVQSFTIAGGQSGYTVTWAPNGGTVNPTSSSNVTTVTAPTPTLAGNAFNGWNCSPTGSPANPVAAGTTFTPSAATTCTASWTPYSVGYSVGTGSGTAPTTPNSGVVTLPVQGAMVAPANTTFGGWTCTPGTPSGTIAAGATFTPSGNATCTAVWTPAGSTYTVTWAPNGGSVSPTTSTQASSGASVAAPTPTLAGNAFNGWDCVPAGTPANPVAAAASFVPSAATTCTASWTPYTVGYSAGNGSGTAPTTPNSGVVVLPGQGSMTAPSGYTFAGWSCTPGTPSGTIAAAASFTPTGNATCTAQWTAIQVAPPAPPTYLVSFVNQGTTVASTTNVAGTVITCPAAPTRAGYIFQGWSACPAGGSYTITGAATITAIWVEELAAQPNATGGENAHQPEPVTLVVNAALTGQQYVDPTVGIKLTLTPNEADKTQAPLTSDNQVVFKDGRLAHVTGSGLRPNSDVQVYISKSAIAGLNALPVAPAGIGHAKAITFTDPILLGTLKTDANGNFADWLPIPAGLEVGSHVLQVDGYAPDWSLHSANFPVLYAVPHTYSKSLTVYFTPDSAKFTAATTKAVAALIALLPKDGQSFTVDSKGFVFPIDNHTANMRISSARAKAIALALKNGIKALGQQATVDHVGLGRINVAKQTSRRVEATVSWTVFETKG